MFKSKRISVVIPAYNEEKLIIDTLVSIPDFVDKIYVIDDFSSDKTANLVKKYIKSSNISVKLISNKTNRGVGYSIKAGYLESNQDGFDIAIVMAGDNQMDPIFIPELILPIIEGNADYTKGNRLQHKEKHKMPLFRRFGNNLLTLLTKISTGFWEISDPQNGYTAITKEAIDRVDMDSIYDGYGYCNDILLEANTHGLRVVDIKMPPKYGNEVSGIRIGRYSIRLSYILFKGFFRRISKKYGGSNFHPILISYYLSFIFLLLLALFTARMFWIWYDTSEIPKVNAMAVGVLFIISTQLLLFSLWSDSQNNK